MKDYTNYKQESIEMVDWLRAKYGDELNPHIVSILFCQSDSDVWIKVSKKIPTSLADKMTEETINLDFIRDIIDEEDGSIEQLTFSPDTPIEENAKQFFDDKVTLMNTTPLFDD